MKNGNDKDNDNLDNEENLNITNNDENFDMSVFNKMPSNTDILQNTSITNDDVTQLDGKSEVGKKKNFGANNKVLTLSLIACAVIASTYSVIKVQGLASDGVAKRNKLIRWIQKA